MCPSGLKQHVARCNWPGLVARWRPKERGFQASRDVAPCDWMGLAVESVFFKCFSLSSLRIRQYVAPCD